MTPLSVHGRLWCGHDLCGPPLADGLGEHCRARRLGLDRPGRALTAAEYGALLDAAGNEARVLRSAACRPRASAATRRATATVPTGAPAVLGAVRMSSTSASAAGATAGPAACASGSGPGDR